MVGVVYVSWHCYGPAEVLIHPVKCNSWWQGAINLLVAFCRVLVNMYLASISMVYRRACSICMEWSIVLGFFQWYRIYLCIMRTFLPWNQPNLQCILYKDSVAWRGERAWLFTTQLKLTWQILRNCPSNVRTSCR